MFYNPALTLEVEIELYKALLNYNKQWENCDEIEPELKRIKFPKRKHYGDAKEPNKFLGILTAISFILTLTAIYLSSNFPGV